MRTRFSSSLGPRELPGLIHQLVEEVTESADSGGVLGVLEAPEESHRAGLLRSEARGRCGGIAVAEGHGVPRGSRT